MPTTPYSRLLVSLNGGAAAAGGIEAAASDDVDFVYESTIGWPSSPAPYLEIYEAPVGWSPVPSTGWVATDGGGWKYYGTTPPPTIAAPDAAHFGKVACQLVVGGGLKDGALSSDMTSGATVLVRSASVGLESVAWRESTEFDEVRAWIGAVQRDLRLLETSLAAVGALTEAQLRAVSATLTAALPVNSQKITGLANGSASSDAAAFGQIAAAVAAAVSGTTNTLPKIASANVLGDSGVTDDGTTVNTTRFVTCTKSGIGTTKTAGITAINATNSGSNVSPQIGWTVYHSGGTQLNSGFQMAPLSSSTGDLTWYFGTGAGAPSTKHVALTSQNSTWGSGVEAYGFYVLSGGLGGSGLRAFGNNTGGYTWDSGDDALLIKSYNTKSVKIQTGADSGGTGGVTRFILDGSGQGYVTFVPRAVTSSGGAVTFPLATCQNIRHTTTENTTVSFSGASPGMRGTLDFIQGGTGRTVTMPTNGSGVEYDAAILALTVTGIVDPTANTRTVLQYYVTDSPATRVYVYARSTSTIP